MTSNATYITNNILEVFTSPAILRPTILNNIKIIKKIFVLNTFLNARKITEYLKYLENVQLCHHLCHAYNNTLLIA